MSDRPRLLKVSVLDSRGNPQSRVAVTAHHVSEAGRPTTDLGTYASDANGVVLFSPPAGLPDGEVVLRSGADESRLPYEPRPGAPDSIQITVDDPDRSARGIPNRPPGLEIEELLHFTPIGRSPDIHIGSGPCEDLVRSGYTQYEFTIRRLVRDLPTPKSPPPGLASSGGPSGLDHPEIRTGILEEYKQRWWLLGHGLGSLAYSLALAPCEQVKLAFVEWRREDEASREEETAVSEASQHTLSRDQMVNETVESAMMAMQNSKTSNSGFSLNLSAGGYGVGLSVPGTVRSSGSSSKDMSGAALTQISDTTVQAGTSMRELRSTVVMQSTQQEDAQAETRVVRNHNHCHALTVLYYHVLQHFLVETKLELETPVIFFKYELETFTRESLLCYEHILRPALLDESLAACFDKMRETEFDDGVADVPLKDVPPPPAPEPVLGELWKVRVVARLDPPLNDGFAEFKITSSADPSISISWKIASNPVVPPDMGGNAPPPPPPISDVDVELNVVQAFATTGDFDTLPLADIGELTVSYSSQTMPTLQGLAVHVSSLNGEAHRVFEDLAMTEAWKDKAITLQADPPFNQPVPKSKVTLTAVKIDHPCVGRLLDHLNCETLNPYYNRLLWLNEDPQGRAVRFDEMEVGNGLSRLDVIQNRIVGIHGRYVAFPSAIQVPAPPVDPPPPARRVVTLPTRGTFAETLLSHCNACEEIDDTRFWDWQQSPCPGEAPDIEPVSTESRSQQQNLFSTPFPPPIINLVSPPNAQTSETLKTLVEAFKSFNSPQPAAPPKAGASGSEQDKGKNQPPKTSDKDKDGSLEKKKDENGKKEEEGEDPEPAPDNCGAATAFKLIEAFKLGTGDNEWPFTRASYAARLEEMTADWHSLGWSGINSDLGSVSSLLLRRCPGGFIKFAIDLFEQRRAVWGSFEAEIPPPAELANPGDDPDPAALVAFNGLTFGSEDPIGLLTLTGVYSKASLQEGAKLRVGDILAVAQSENPRVDGIVVFDEPLLDDKKIKSDGTPEQWSEELNPDSGRHCILMNAAILGEGPLSASSQIMIVARFPSIAGGGEFLVYGAAGDFEKHIKAVFVCEAKL